MLGTPEQPYLDGSPEQCPRCGSTDTHSVSIGSQTIEYRCDACNRFFRVTPDDEQEICPRCKGAMRIPDLDYGDEYSDDAMMTCPECEGDGAVSKAQADDYRAWVVAFSKCG